MRAIKFRAWDGRHMIDPVIGDDVNSLNTAISLIERRYEHLMQYTGLLDCHGKEIYEGDRVHYWNGLGEHFKGIVQFNDGCFDVVMNSHSYPVRDYLKVHVGNHSIEVIGNIYENPELKEAQDETAD